MKKPIILLLAFIFVNDSLCSQPSEHESLSIILRTNKKTYFPFEPIVLTTEFKNVSKENQWYDEPQILGTAVQHKVYHNKKEIHPYSQFDEIIGRGGVGEISGETAIKPGVSKTSNGIISKYFDLFNKYGIVKIEVRYPIIGEIKSQWGYIVGYKTESTTVKVIKEPDGETVPVQLFSESVSRLLGRNGYDNKVKENLEKILSEYPGSYLIDQAYYFLSYYYYQAHRYEHKPEQLEGAKKYLSEFFQRFPQSVYRGEAEALEREIKRL